MSDAQMSFDNRFLDQYTGKRLLKDPIVAIIELVANSWDAGASRVDITWPSEIDDELIIADNGEGMTEEEFTYRWYKFSYDRLKEQGDTVRIVGDYPSSPRKTFGRNGIGRFAGFCFSSVYRVATSKSGKMVRYSVQSGGQYKPIDLVRLGEEESQTTGTSIEMRYPPPPGLTSDRIKSEIGMRFLTDPNFCVYVNGDLVAFEDLPEDGVEHFVIDLPDGQKVRMILVDAQKTDRTTKQHGIAWHVNGRLVGECTWQGSGQESLIDGRRIEAKRYTFIVFADVLDSPEIIKADWSGFHTEHPYYQMVGRTVQSQIHEILLGLTQERREETTSAVRHAHAERLRKMSPVSREKWEVFVERVQEECPSLEEKELVALSGVLANLELSQSKFSLIERLHDLRTDQLDSLHNILKEWTVDVAKTVLDELQWRLRLIAELRAKTSSNETLEVQELQPLFERGLWIFGPEFETIEFTSNQGMTAVVQSLFDSKEKGSLNRPDFVVLPDGSAGLYSYPEYDESYAEVGVARLVVVELKKPGVQVGDEQKQQTWKYIKELYQKGHLTARSKVECYVLGSRIDQAEADPTWQKDRAVMIRPLLFHTVLARAESRVFKLYEKVKSAPFLQDQQIEKFLDFKNIEPTNPDLFSRGEEDLTIVDMTIQTTKIEAV